MRERHREIARRIGEMIEERFDTEGESDWLDRVEGVRNRVWRFRMPDREVAPIRGEARMSLAPAGQEPFLIFDAALDFPDIDRCNSQLLRAMTKARLAEAELDYRLVEEFRNELLTFSVTIGVSAEFDRQETDEPNTVELEVRGDLDELFALAEEVENMVYVDDRPRASHDEDDEERPGQWG